MTTAAIVLVSILAVIAVKWFLAYHGANGLAWSFALAVGVGALHFYTRTPPALLIVLWAVVTLFAAFSIVKPLRRAVVTGRRGGHRGGPSRRRTNTSVSTAPGTNTIADAAISTFAAVEPSSTANSNCARVSAPS